MSEQATVDQGQHTHEQAQGNQPFDADSSNADSVASATLTPDPSDSSITLKVAMAETVSPHTTADIPAEKSTADDDPGRADLEAQLSELRDLLRSEQKARTEAESARQAQSEAARKEWLEGQGLIRWDYQALAPTAEEADPFTEEGRRSLAKFRQDNPSLFKGSLEPPSAKPGASDRIGRKRWRDIMGEVTRGIND